MTLRVEWQSLQRASSLLLALVFALALVLDGAVGASASQPSVAQPPADIRPSVVKIFTTATPPEMRRPWTRAAPVEFTGSGVVIEGNRILTNAHVVNYATRVLVQSSHTGDRFVARVVAVAEGIDLALLELEDPRFFEFHPLAAFADHLPAVGESVLAYGYPLGGTELSLTRGIVSRIEYTAYNYDVQGLRIQIDAALNPGNSGGPAVVDGLVIGLVFSGISQADNIGYLIPTEEIAAFLRDVSDGTYGGQPYLLDLFQSLENLALRNMLGLAPETTGVLVGSPWSTDPGYPLKQWDVVTHIGDVPIDNRGMILYEDTLRLYFEYLAPRFAVDGRVPLTVHRDGATLQVEAPVASGPPRLLPYLKNDYPSYFMYGPLVFTPAYAEHLDIANLFVLTSRVSPLAGRAHDRPAFDGEQLVVLSSPVFPHRMAVGYQVNHFPVLESVNGVEIRNLYHLVETLRDLTDEYVVFEWHDRFVDTVVFRRQEALQATQEILEANGIRRQYSLDLAPAWERR